MEGARQFHNVVTCTIYNLFMTVRSGSVLIVSLQQNQRPARMSWHHLIVESGAGAPALGSGGLSVAFAPGLSPAPMAAFPVPRSPNPACGFPAPGSPVGSCTSHTDHQNGSWGGGGGEEPVGPVARGRCTTAILPPASFPVCRRACSRPGGVEPFGSDPFASACDAFRSLCPQGGVIG